LKAQKDCEDESTKIAFGNLRSEVITLRYEALEKAKILLSLVKRLKTSEANLARLSEADEKISKFEKEKEADAKHIANLEYALFVQVGLHKSEVAGLEKKLDEATENFNVEQSKHEISDTKRSMVQKNVEELRQAKEECYVVVMQCSEKLKIAFTSVGAFLAERNFIRGDPEGVIKWIEGEIEVFDKVLTGRVIFVPA
jgi:DNA repair exonuclease SbcCD ATPase subunit